jgi:hypothetical protein
MQFGLFKGVIQLTSIILLIGLSLPVSGCKSSRDMTGSTLTDTKDKSDTVSPMILLLNFEISSTDTVKLINSMFNRGLLREREPFSSEPTECDLIISILDNSGELCAEKLVPNPLIKVFEYSEDGITLKTKQVCLQAAHFFVRVQFQSCMKYVRVERVTEDQTVVLDTFTIPTNNSPDE